MSQANPGRIAAVRALMAVEGGAHAEDCLPGLAPDSGPDRGLAWHIALGVLRRQGSIDATLRPHLRQPLRKLQPLVRNCLRLGVFEAHLSRVPARAAVHQAVEVCRAGGLARATGLVNAVLRKAVTADFPDDPFLDLPPWLQQRWAGWGPWVERLREPAPIHIVCETAPEMPAVPSTIGGEAVPSLWRLEGSIGAVSAMPGFDEGQWWVMDAAAAKVADLVVQNTPPGGSVLDACAAPGGKTFRMRQAGLQVVAVDVDLARLQRLEENAQRIKRPGPSQAHDWMKGPSAELGRFDSVLVDAPCTGLGTVRRHPEIRWRRKPDDLLGARQQQRRILANASEHVGPAGALIYAVCSTETEEGPEVISTLEGWCVESAWSSAPPTGDEDGFQAFVLRREDGS